MTVANDAARTALACAVRQARFYAPGSHSGVFLDCAVLETDTFTALDRPMPSLMTHSTRPALLRSTRRIFAAAAAGYGMHTSLTCATQRRGRGSTGAGCPAPINLLIDYILYI